MIAGLPGTGIGGMFYAIATLFMPVREVRPGNRRRRLIVRQMLLAVAVITTMWITGDLVGRCLAAVASRGTQASVVLGHFTDPEALASGKYNILTVPFLFYTLGAIFLLHAIMHGLRLGLRIRRWALKRGR